MRIVVILALLGMPFLGMSSFLYAEDQGTAKDHLVSLETFDEYQPPAFPEQWKVRGDEGEAHTIYRVAEENGNRFLHAHTDKQGVQIGLSRAFQSKEFPLLQWRWRVEQLPLGADERSVKTNDSAAAVYVIFDSTIIPRVIKYVWSSTLPVGKRVDSPVYWRAKIVVLQSGPSHSSEWRQETVNIYEDYKNLFGTEPGEAQGIAVLTDSDTTKSVAEADYDDFALLSTGALPPEDVDKTAALLMPAADGGQ
jgi:hypothetical protein